jgi:serine/threonine-protein kinase
MIRLTLLHPQSLQPLRQWQFDAETLIRVGRAPGNDVILNNPIVSRFHLELRALEASPSQPHPRWLLVNLSSNGTFMDGGAIAQGVIDDNAIIQLAYDGPSLRVQLEPRSPTPSTSSSTPILVVPSVSTGSTAPTHCTHAGNAPENIFCMHCGQPIQVEKTVRQYQVLRVLGRGGMGTTYLVWQPEPNRVTAEPDSTPLEVPAGKLQVLKEMNADIAQIPKAQELFEREASTLKTLNHPGIPQYFDFFVEADKKYLVMELIHGQDLEKMIRQKGPVPLESAIAWMIQTCEILDYLHTRPTPIIHRDVKPGNLLIRTIDQRVVLLDFGAVKAAGLSPSTRIGAEGYSAPEQIQGRPLTQSDLYSIGPSLVYLLTSKNPLRLQKREDPFHRLDLEKIVGLPRRLHLIIQRVTEPDPSDRYQTAKDLIRALKTCLG